MCALKNSFSFQLFRSLQFCACCCFLPSDHMWPLCPAARVVATCRKCGRNPFVTSQDYTGPPIVKIQLLISIFVWGHHLIVMLKLYLVWSFGGQTSLKNEPVSALKLFLLFSPLPTWTNGPGSFLAAKYDKGSSRCCSQLYGDLYLNGWFFKLG